MTQIISNEAYVRHFDPDSPSHRLWLKAVLDHVTASEPYALSVGPLREAWTARVEPAREEDLELATALIKEFEGLELRAYPDPGTGGVPWTIGWGMTRWPDGRPVRPGETISRVDADAALAATIRGYRKVQATRIPTWSKMSAPQRAALISFSYNLGANWFGSEGFGTLTRVVGAGEWQQVPAVLELYRNPGTNVEAGLLRRRRAEGKMFAQGTSAPARPSPLPPEAGRPPAAAVYPNPLRVYPYLQLDSETDQAARMCFSSANAMLLEHMKPGTLKGPNGDDQYLRVVQRFGDTTSVEAQLAALRHYGLKVEFVQNANFELVSRQIRDGIPVPAPYIHRGPVSRPTGFGHWLTIIGDPRPDSIVVNDPLGEPDLVSGRTLNTRGAGLTFSKKNFGARWMVEPIGGGAYRYAPNKGWAIIARR